MTLSEVRHVVFSLMSKAVSMGLEVPEVLAVESMKGRSAGQCQYHSHGAVVLRFNMAMLNDHPGEWADTIVHEVGHAVARCSYGAGIRPHGWEWKSVCRRLGGTGKRCHTIAASQYKARRSRQYVYHVSGERIMVGATRHKRLQAGQMEYRHKVLGPIRAEFWTGESKLR